MGDGLGTAGGDIPRFAGIGLEVVEFVPPPLNPSREGGVRRIVFGFRYSPG